MPRNGSGNYSAPNNSWNPPVDGDQIDPADFQELLDDIEAAMSGSIAADGQTTTTAVIPFDAGARVAPGSAASPGLGFVNDTNTGLFRPAADTVALGGGGTEFLRLSAAVAKIVAPQVLINDTSDDTVVWRDASTGALRWLSSSDRGSAGAGFPVGLIARNLGTSGYFNLAGFIIQWGTGTSSTDGLATVTFPLQFPTSCVYAAPSRTSSSSQAANRTSLTTAQMGVRVYNTTTNADLEGFGFSWFAMGY